jgi:NAD dependent epimerase/dehydratase family enzyme
VELQNRIRIVEGQDPNGQTVNKIRHIETLIEQRDHAQGEFEPRLAVLKDSADLDQIGEDVRERLAQQIAEAIAESRYNITKSLREMVQETVRQQIPPPLPPRPTCSPRQCPRSPRH